MISRMLARFDRQVLRPPDGLSHPGQWRAPSPEELGTWQALRNWCFDGTCTEAVRPAPRELPARLAIAVLQGGSAEARARLIESLCQELDGSVQLAACASSLARLRLRLGVKIKDSLPWRRRRVSDPWDCGYLDERPECLEGLRRFMPRRMTLMVAHGLKAESVMRCVEALSRGQASFVQPVRLLIDGEPGRDTPGFHGVLEHAGGGASISSIRFEA